MDLFYIVNNVSDLIVGPNVQLAVGVVDMCSAWQYGYGDCAVHSPAPWFDNIKLCRCQVRGPNWNFRDIDLFQDNFPSNADDIESWVRADAANDIYPPGNLDILPADAVVINCAAPDGQSLANDDGRPAVYMHVKCSYIGPTPDKPSLFGPMLEGDHGRYHSDDGVWTIIQGDSATVIRDAYLFDLNDSLLTRGYKVEYYFTARSRVDETTRLPGRPMDPSCSRVFEFTCLPTLRSSVLFVDDFVGPTLDSDVLMDDGLPGYDSWEGFAENYWMPTFKAVFLPPNDIPDKYDVNGASSLVSNGLASRAHLKHLKEAYDIIIWDCGDLERGTITDGTPSSDKSNDCALLIDWMNTSPHPCGLWICGDNIAHDLTVNCLCGMALLNNWCGVNYIMDSYFGLTGTVSPLLAGNAAGIFYEGGVPYQFAAFGGCPIINRFDVIGVGGTGTPAINYPDYTGLGYYAGIQNESINLYGQPVRTMWFGFSFQSIRDDDFHYSPIDRNIVAQKVLEWIEIINWKPDISEGEVPAANSVAQNYPNPFNPSTTIKYEIRRKGMVTLKVYDISGALVRTLVDEVKDRGSHTAIWDGKNNRGASVASGIYLYKMETAGFSKTKKMVLLR
jgi:hypothetical protein